MGVERTWLSEEEEDGDYPFLLQFFYNALGAPLAIGCRQ